MNIKTKLERLASNPAHKSMIGDGRLITKSAVIATPVVDRNQRLVKGIISTPDVDQDNEVVQCANLDTSYFPENIKTVYIDHDYERYPMGVGVCRAMSVTGDRLYASTYVMPTALGDDLLTAIEHEAIRHYSIGAKVFDAGPPTGDEVARYGIHKCNVRKGMLIEYSFTAMPTNPNAMIELVSKSMIRRDNAVALGLDDTPTRKFWPTVDHSDYVVRIDTNDLA